MRRMTTEERSRAMGMLQEGAGKPFVHRMFTNLGLMLHTTKDTKSVTFRSPGVLDAGIQPSGAYADGQRK